MPIRCAVTPGRRSLPRPEGPRCLRHRVDQAFRTCASAFGRGCAGRWVRLLLVMPRAGRLWPAASAPSAVPAGSMLQMPTSNARWWFAQSGKPLRASSLPRSFFAPTCAAWRSCEIARSQTAQAAPYLLRMSNAKRCRLERLAVAGAVDRWAACSRRSDRRRCSLVAAEEATRMGTPSFVTRAESGAAVTGPRPRRPGAPGPLGLGRRRGRTEASVTMHSASGRTGHEVGVGAGREGRPHSEQGVTLHREWTPTSTARSDEDGCHAVREE